MFNQVLKINTEKLRLIFGSFILLLILVLQSNVFSSDLKIWYRQPAKEWTEALPVGNGRLGAMVFGGIKSEHIQLNENTVWSGKQNNFDRIGAYRYLANVRQLLFEGKYIEAEKIVNQEFYGERPLYYYQPLGDIYLKFKTGENASHYRRTLDLDTAVATVSYSENGANFNREVFVSYPDQVIVIHLACNKPGLISADLSLSRIADADSEVLSDDTIALSGQVDRAKLTEGVDFEAYLKVIAKGGRVTRGSNNLEIEKADEVTLLLAASTSYKSSDPAKTCREQLAAAAEKSYEELKKAHITDYQRLFRRVDINLGKTDAVNLPTNERLEALKNSRKDLSLVALYFQYGRYLLISSSRPGGLPANLQGIWNSELKPPWFCGFHFDINFQMNYWPAEVCNLSECHEPFFNLLERLRINGRKTAKDVYNCRGFFVSHRTTPSLFTSTVKGLIIWPVSSGWLCQHLWEHYLFTGDKDFLAMRAYPVMKEAAEFYLDWLVENPKTGKLVSGPSFSPENQFFIPDTDIKKGLTMGPAMDQQIIWELFSNCLEAAKILGIEDNYIKEVRNKRNRLDRGLNIGSDSRLLEWAQEFEEVNPGHRHLSHLFALYPGNQITQKESPELVNAVRKSLEHRLEAGSGKEGWSRAWVINLWARLKRGDKAYETIIGQLNQSTRANLFTVSHNCFQIDGNFGGTAGIAEMLLQSQSGEIQLLPALPQAWGQGSVKGLRARGGFKVDIQWQEGKLTEAVILSKNGAKCKVRYNEAVMDFETDPGGRYTLKGQQFQQKATSAKVEIIKEDTPVIVDPSLIGSRFSNNSYEIELMKDNSIRVKNTQGNKWANFTPKFTVWYNPENPKLSFSYNYNVIEKWKAGTSSVNYQVPAWNGDYDFFHAPGSKYVLYANSAIVRGSTLTWEFPRNNNFKLTADLRLSGEYSEPELTFHLSTKEPGYYTVGYIGVQEKSPEATDWIWQPLIWQGKRFPLVSYFTQEYRFPIPAILMGIDDTTVGLAVDPKESPYRLPERHNSRFGGLIRNSEAKAQPMIFAPVYGGPGSKMAAGDNFDFTIRLIVKSGDWYETYKDLAYNTYGFHDYRKNGICTLNETLDNMVEFVLTDKYSYWFPEMKTNGYQTDKKGWGRQQSAVSPLSLAMVRDNQDLYDHRALPSIEYMTSRKMNLVKLDGSIPFMSGPGSTVMDWTALYLMGDKRTELFAEFAKQKAGDILNAAQLSEKGQVTREQALSQAKDLLRPLVAMYRLSDEPKYLNLAKKLADDYIYWRIDRQPIDFYDVGSSFWNEIAPIYDILYELFEISGDNKYLDAAVRSMSQFTGFVYLQPTIPNKNIMVNKGGSFRGVPGIEESVPAWRVSANGLMSECAGTSHSHRGIFMAPYAAYMIKLARYTNEQFYLDIARGAMVGRYANYPSYAYRHGHTTIYEKPDYPLRSFEELTWTSEHYNHPMPMCSYIVDYLLGEAFYRSAGRIYFPSRYTDTGAYFRNQVYGDRPGKFYGDVGAWLWLPKGLMKLDNLQVNYIAAHGNGKLYLALMNQSNESVTTNLSLNPELVTFENSKAKIWKENEFTGETKVEVSKITVDIEAKGIVALAIDNTMVKTSFQYKYINDSPSTLSKRSFKEIQTSFGKVTGMIISIAKPLTSSYIWLESSSEQLNKTVLYHSTNDKWEKLIDDKYPFEFTVKLDGSTDSFNFYIEGLENNGSIEKSEIVNLKLCED